MSTQGASNNERLIAAARTDREETLLEIFEQGGFDINFKDGLGNTALHYAAMKGSTDVLEHILTHEDCDVDPINRIERATPLHLAMRLPDPETRAYVVSGLLDAGADTTIKDKNGDTAIDLIPAQDTQLKSLFRKEQADRKISASDIANDDDDDGSAGSASDDE